MSINPSVIIDAWKGMWPALTSTFQSQVTGSSVKTVTVDVSNNGSCAANESPPGPNQDTCYASGQGTVSFTGMKISNFSVTNGLTATVNGNTATLPMQISVLETNGNYNYYQPCTCEYMKAKSGSSAGSNGSVTQTVSTFQLIYDCSIAADGTLSITGVRINGNPNTNLSPNTGLPSWFSKFISFVSGDDQVIQNLQSSVGNLFQTAEFSTVLMQKMNNTISNG